MPAAGSCVIVDEVRDGLASWKTAAAIGDLGAAEIEILGDTIAPWSSRPTTAKWIARLPLYRRRPAPAATSGAGTESATRRALIAFTGPCPALALVIEPHVRDSGAPRHLRPAQLGLGAIAASSDEKTAVR